MTKPILDRPGVLVQDTCIPMDSKLLEFNGFNDPNWRSPSDGGSASLEIIKEHIENQPPPTEEKSRSMALLHSDPPTPSRYNARPVKLS